MSATSRFYIFLFALSLFAFVPAFAQTENTPPNVIFLLVDDLGYGDLSAHGNPRLRTPNLDRLSRESVRFIDHHVAPMCTPTRGELMTGISAFRNGASAVAQGRSIPRRELSLMPEFFRDNGYATAHLGKWHLGDNHPFRPHERGFDFSIYSKGFGTDSLADHWLNDTLDDHFWQNNTLLQFPGYNTDVFFNEAMSWIRQQTTPFFVYLATTASHEPHYVDSSYEKPYEELPAALAAFFGVTAELDDNVGRLMKFLDENGLAENTILIYMTDNGSVERTLFYTASMRGRKASLYEGGHRVPFFMRWPRGLGGESRDIDTLTHSTDLLPTLIELAGLKHDRPTEFDGTSLVPLLEGRAESLSGRKLVVQYGPEFKEWDSAVLWKRWRLVRGEELYDLASDPGQKTDIAKSRPDVVKILRTHYNSWLGPSKEQMGARNHIVVGSPAEPVTTLTSADWIGPYCGDWGELGVGASPLFGHWDIQAETSDNYAVSLYLFPPESQTGLDQAFRNVPARPVARARLILDDTEYVVETPHGATHAEFELPLESDKQYRIEGQFLDAAGVPLWGAVYLLVQAIRP